MPLSRAVAACPAPLTCVRRGKSLAVCAVAGCGNSGGRSSGGGGGGGGGGLWDCSFAGCWSSSVLAEDVCCATAARLTLDFPRTARPRAAACTRVAACPCSLGSGATPCASSAARRAARCCMPLEPERKFVVGCGCDCSSCCSCCSCTPRCSPSAPARPVATPAFPSVVERVVTIPGLALSCALCDACTASASALASSASAADCRSLAAGPASPRCAALAASASAVASAAAAARAAPSTRGAPPPRADTVAAVCVAGEARLLAGAARLLRLLAAASCGLVARRAMRGAAAVAPLSAAPLCRRPTALPLSGAQAREACEERCDCTAPPTPPRCNRWVAARCNPLGCGATRCVVPIGAVARRRRSAGSAGGAEIGRAHV